jgi:hypothetical protein
MKRSDQFLLQQVGGENLLVPLGAQVMDLNGLIVLNETGRYLWERLATDCSEAELAAAIAGQFAVDDATARADVRAFLAEITTMGLVAG